MCEIPVLEIETNRDQMKIYAVQVRLRHLHRTPVTPNARSQILLFA